MNQSHHTMPPQATRPPATAGRMVTEVVEDMVEEGEVEVEEDMVEEVVVPSSSQVWRACLAGLRPGVFMWKE